MLRTFFIRKKFKNIPIESNSSYLCDLPILVIEFILNYLSYDDLISLKRTCKKFKNIIDNRKFKELFVFIHSYPCFKSLFYTDELIFYSNSLQIYHSNTLRSTKFKNTFKKIKKLSIYRDVASVSDDSLFNLVINLKDLNSYDQLEHLELKIGKVKGKLNLKTLQICCIQTKLESKFDLDCENLKALAILHYAKPTLISAEKLIYLHIDSTTDSSLEIQKLTSIVTLSCGLISTFRQIISDFNTGLLSSLKFLKRIQCLDWASSYFENYENLISELKLFEQSQFRNQIQIYLNDKQLVNSNRLIEILELIRNHDANWKYFGCIQRNDLEFIVRNSNQLNFIFSFVRKLTLNDRLNHENRNLIDQFKNIELKNLEFLVFQSTDELLIDLFFNHWIKKWLKIRILELKIHLEQEQYNLMSKYLLNLKNLILNFKPDNLEFIVKLKI